MTGRHGISSSRSRAFPRPVRATVGRAVALLVGASLAVGCGVVPGVTGGDGDDGTITVMTWAPQDTNATNKPGMPALALAYARWINSRGGLNGRELHVLNCNERNDSVTAAKCAERAVDEGAVAVVGSYSQHADSFFPTLESAGIPYIGGYGLTAAEFTSPLSYPVNGGQPSLLAGLGRELADKCGPVSLVRPDSIAGDELAPVLNSGLSAGGHAEVRDVLAAEDATEYAAPSQRALEHASADPARPGCVVPALGDRTSTFMDSFRRRGEDSGVRTATVLGSVDQTVINASGGKSGPYEGAYITGWYPVASDKRWDGMKKVINTHAFGDNRIDPADAGVQTTWIACTVLRAAIESIGDGEVTARSVRRALDNGLSIDTGGLTPELSWDYSETFAAVGLPQLVNAEVTLQVVRGGRLVSARTGFVDVTKTLQRAELR
ncbi:ABC transporter substrate-binding protein [Streptomyces sp. FZ201]|uniref:ABC transporter substrate-binding protein n=1 Tax=Streptomyces sp. FZ201 TaxID=3057122 RepID=UPI0021C1EEC1|nr:ABC transporter substrate-binding protein [Streptomyces sp. FZ201]